MFFGRHRVENNGRHSIFVHTPGHMKVEVAPGETYEGIILSIYHGANSANYKFESIETDESGD